MTVFSYDGIQLRWHSARQPLGDRIFENLPLSRIMPRKSTLMRLYIIYTVVHEGHNGACRAREYIASRKVLTHVAVVDRVCI